MNDKRPEQIKGTEIDKIFTLKTMYDQDSIGLTDYSGFEFRLEVEELYKVINELVFTVKKKQALLYGIPILML